MNAETQETEAPAAPVKTLRDEFAMAALTGLCAAQAGEAHFNAMATQAAMRNVDLVDIVVGMAYEAADRMMRRREHLR